MFVRGDSRMKQFLFSAIAMALLTCTATAAEPRSLETAKEVKPGPVELQTGIPDDDFVIPRGMPARRPLHIRLIDFVECPIKPIVEYLDSPNSGLRRLLDGSEDLQRARDHFRRFRMASSQMF